MAKERLIGDSTASTRMDTFGLVSVEIICPSLPGSYSHSPRSKGNKLLGVPKVLQVR